MTEDRRVWLPSPGVEGGCYGCGDDNEVGLGLVWLPVDRTPREGRVSPTLTALFTPRPEHRGAPGILHGGLAATALDECMAALSHALDDLATVTATLELRYRRPVPLDGSAVRIESWRDRAQPRARNKVHGRLLLSDGTLAVEATGLFLTIGPAEVQR